MRALRWIILGAVMAIGAGALVLRQMSLEDTPPPLPPGAKADAILIEKAAHRMSLLRDGKVLATYRVSLGSGGLAPKRREGDRLVPEGSYFIEGRNPKSAYHLSLKISYPSPADRKAAAKRGEPPGGDNMIHGLPNGLGWVGPAQKLGDWTAGCIAVTNAEMDVIWRVVPDGTPVEIRA